MEQIHVSAFHQRYRQEYETTAKVEDHFNQNSFAVQDEYMSMYFKNLVKNHPQKKTYDADSDLHLLDVGCGSGKQTSLFANYFEKVTALGGEDQIENAKKVFPAENISYMVGTSSMLPVDDDSVDVISCIFTAHQFPDMTKFISECNRVLKLGGVVGIWCDNLSNVELESQPRSHTNAATKKLCAELNAECQRCVVSFGDCEWHVFDCYQTLFDSISGMNKSLHYGKKFDVAMTLEELLFLCMGVTVFQHVELAWHKFAEKLKQLWNLESFENKDIKLRVTRAPSVIILTKT